MKQAEAPARGERGTAGTTAAPKLYGILGLIVGLVRSGALQAMTGAHAKLVLALLSHFPRIHPGLDCLAEETGLHRITVSKANRALERLGWLTVKRAGPRSNAYEMVAPRLTHPPKRVSPLANSFTEKSKPLGLPKDVREREEYKGRKERSERKDSPRAPRARGTSCFAKTPAGKSKSTIAPDKTTNGAGSLPGVPASFAEWLLHLNAGLGLLPPRGYKATSPMGRRLAVAYARVLGEGYTADDLRRAVDVAMGKAMRGFEAARRPNWILANMDELSAEASQPVAAKIRGGGKREAPGAMYRRDWATEGVV